MRQTVHISKVIPFCFGRYLSLSNLRDANQLIDEIKRQVDNQRHDFLESDLIQFIAYLLET